MQRESNMADLKRLDDKREADRLTAQLGMAASERSEVEGECLTSEQLADVATNYCSPEERKAALAHFATCQKCYDAWVGVSLSLVAMESGLERRKRPLLSMRNLGYLGSAMAVAASVMVFLNIQGDMTQIVPVAEKGVEISAQDRLEEKDLAQPAASVPAPAMQKEMRAKRSVVESPALESAPKKQEQIGGAQLFADDANMVLEAEAEPGEKASWYAELTDYCRKKEYTSAPQRWQTLMKQGRGLASSPSGEDATTMRILELMRGVVDQTTMAARCEAILPLVAGVGKKE